MKRDLNHCHSVSTDSTSVLRMFLILAYELKYFVILNVLLKSALTQQVLVFYRWISLPKYKNGSVWLKTLQYTGYEFRILCLIILTESPLRLWLPHEFEALHVAGCQAVWLKGSNFIFKYFITASQRKTDLETTFISWSLWFWHSSMTW